MRHRNRRNKRVL